MNLVCVATIVTAHGIKGEVKIRTHTESPDSIGSYSPLLDASGKKKYAVHIRKVIGPNMIIASIDGVTSRNQAESLRQVELYTKRKHLPKPNKNEYYHIDLIGLDVQLQDKTPFGTVLALHNYGAGDIIEIMPHQAKDSVLLPFNDTVILDVNIKEEVITIAPPEHIEIDYE